MRVLMVTSEWPTLENPYWVPFIVRQVEFLMKAGVEIDVFAFRGARNPINYLRAWWEFAGNCGNLPMILCTPSGHRVR